MGVTLAILNKIGYERDANVYFCKLDNTGGNTSEFFINTGRHFIDFDIFGF